MWLCMYTLGTVGAKQKVKIIFYPSHFWTHPFLYWTHSHIYHLYFLALELLICLL